MNNDNDSLIANFKLLTNDVTTDENLTDTSNSKGNVNFISVQSLSSLINSSKSPISDIVKDFVYQSNKTDVTTEIPINNSPVVTSETKYIVDTCEKIKFSTFSKLLIRYIIHFHILKYIWILRYN